MSAIERVSVTQGCPLEGVPLYIVCTTYSGQFASYRVTVSTGKYYTQVNGSSFGTFPNNRLMLGDRLNEVTAGSGSTVFAYEGAIQVPTAVPLSCK